MKQYDYDVVIAGGGPAGVCAAVSAARLGASVLIIEQYGCLGGMSTVGQVAPWMTFHNSDGTQVIQGIGQEIVERLMARGMSRGHVRDTMGETWTITPFDNEGLKLLLSEMCYEEDIHLLLHTFVYGCERQENKISALNCANKDGQVRVTGRCFIDATGDGDLFAFAGCDYWLGREEDHLMQPCSMNFSMYNVDFEKVRLYMLEHPEDFHYKTNFTLLEKNPPDSVSGFFSKWNQGKEEMGLDIQRERILFFRGIRDDVATVNTTRLTAVDSTSADSMTQAEHILRRQVHQVSELLQRYVPGFENAQLLTCAPVVGIREGRRLNGAYCLTGDDLRAGRRFEDDIAIYAYPIDQHHPDGPGFTECKVPAFGIPYRSLVPKDVENLLVAGRCVSCDREAQSSIRTTPGVMAMGQAAGIAAVQIAGGTTAQTVNTTLLRSQLRQSGAYLG